MPPDPFDRAIQRAVDHALGAFERARRSGAKLDGAWATSTARQVVGQLTVTLRGLNVYPLGEEAFGTALAVVMVSMLGHLTGALHGHGVDVRRLN